MFSIPVLTPNSFPESATSRKSQEGVNASSSFVLMSHSKAVMDLVTAQPTDERDRGRLGEMKTGPKEMEPAVKEVMGVHILNWWHFFYQCCLVSIIVQHPSYLQRVCFVCGNEWAIGTRNRKG